MHNKTPLTGSAASVDIAFIADFVVNNTVVDARCVTLTLLDDALAPKAVVAVMSKEDTNVLVPVSRVIVADGRPEIDD